MKVLEEEICFRQLRGDPSMNATGHDLYEDMMVFKGARRGLVALTSHIQEL